MSERLDIKYVAGQALASALSLLQAWLQDGRREGHEFKARNPTRSDDKIGSFSVNLNTGAWADFADSSPDAKGGDLVSLYAYLNGLSQLEAGEAVAEQLGIPVPPRAHRSRPAQASKGERVPAKRPQKSSTDATAPEKEPGWEPILPVPADAPEIPKAHTYRGLYSRIWTYRNASGEVLGYVCRFEKSDGSKETLPLTFCRHAKTGKYEWRWMSFPEPRPLYGLDRLAQNPDAFVLLVEGEKCADAAQEQLPDRVVITWPGGSKAVEKADWSPLQGRNVAGWADCDAQREVLTKAEKAAGVDKNSKPILPEKDQPGVAAMRKIGEKALALGARWWDVTIPAPGEKPAGWDVADAIAEGLIGADLAKFIGENRVERKPTAGDGGAGRSPPATQVPAGDVEEGRERPYVPDLLFKKGELVACLSNVYLILAHRPEWRGVIAYDEFSLRVSKRKTPPFYGGAIGEWGDVDDSRTAMWLSQEYGFTPSSPLVSEAVKTLAAANSFHPVREYLNSLTWDGEQRLDTWLPVFAGAEDREYTRLVGRWWMMGAVARVMQPGCKFDYCLVLEGEQGKKKSSTFSIIGGDWFGDTDLDFANKDSMIALAGKLVYELAELGALARSDERRQKSFLSRRYDEFRPPYGRTYIKAPRQLVFGGSTNEWEWNKDPTGGRRFWPVECKGDIDLEALIAARDQLFAEAFHLFKSGERYWPDADQQKKIFDPEQLRVEQPEGYVDALHDWVFEQTELFSLADAILKGLKLDASKLTRDTQTRVGVALRKLGCTRVERRNGMVRFAYKPPEKRWASSKPAQPAQQEWGPNEQPF